MAGPSTLSDAQCPRCLELEDEICELHQRLAAVGHYVTYTPGPSPTANLERELQRWLAVNSCADAAAGFRAGWARLSRFVGPKLRDIRRGHVCAPYAAIGKRAALARCARTIASERLSAACFGSSAGGATTREVKRASGFALCELASAGSQACAPSCASQPLLGVLLITRA